MAFHGGRAWAKREILAGPQPFQPRISIGR